MIEYKERSFPKYVWQFLNKNLSRLAASLKPYLAEYKVYSALVTQVGTNPPTAVVLKNTLGDVNVSYAYNGVGSYAVDFSSNILTSSTNPGETTNWVMIQGCSSNGDQLGGAPVIWAYYSTASQIAFEVYDVSTGAVGNGFLEDNYIEIRVYS